MRTRPQYDTSSNTPPSERQQIMALLRFLALILVCVMGAALIMTVVLTLTS